MALDRTWYNSLRNDTGNKDGTLWRKEDVDALMNATDAEIARLDGVDAAITTDLTTLEAETNANVARLDGDIVRLDAADAALAADLASEITALDDPTIARTNEANLFIQDQRLSGDVAAVKFEFPGTLGKGRLLMPEPASLGLSWNADWTGSAWVRDDPNVAALSMAINQNQEFVFSRWAAEEPQQPHVNLFRIGTQGQIYERNRSVALGKWSPVTFNPSDFSTGVAGSTWTVNAIAHQLHRFSLMGETLFWRIVLGYSGGVSDITGNPAPHLLITPPPGVVLISGQAVRLPLASVNGASCEVIIDTSLPPYFRLVRADGQSFTGRVNLMGGVTFEILAEVLP